MEKRKLYVTGFGIALVLFFAVNILSSAALRSARLDLTENGLYSLTDGTRNIVSSLTEPVRLKLFFSEKLSQDMGELQSMRTYGTRVRELLDEYTLMSKGKIELTVVDPEPYSEAEDEAVQSGIAGLAVGASQEKFYFGLLGTSSTDDEATLPFFDPSNEPLLEYDITKLVYGLANPARAVVGIVSSLDMEGGPGNPMMGQQGTPPWAILTQLEESFEVLELGQHVRNVPEEVDVLLVVHPKEIPETTKYAIDQFALRGGRVMLFVDPQAEADQPPDPTDRMARFSYKRASTFDPILEAWGLRLLPGKIAADRSRATQVRSGGAPTDFVAWLTLRGGDFDPDDATVSLLDRIVMPAPGILQEVEDTELTVVPLVHTSRDAMQVDASQLLYPDPHELLRNFVPEDTEFTLAARVTGRSRTAFPGGRPIPSSEEQPPEEEVEGSDGEDPAHLKESESDLNVIVVADVDLLEETYWLQRQQLGPIFLGFRKTADNGDFVINCLDNLAGSDDLISVRGRMKFARPFARVEEIQKAAEQNYLREVQDLQDSIASTEQRIVELQGSRQDASGLILSSEQQAEIEKLRDQQIATRRKLRSLQHEMRSDIESLGMRLKLVHIAIVPAVFSLGALAFGVWRSKRRTG